MTSKGSCLQKSYLYIPFNITGFKVKLPGGKVSQEHEDKTIKIRKKKKTFTHKLTRKGIKIGRVRSKEKKEEGRKE